MKVLQVNKFFYPRGGAERYFIDLLELLPERGHPTAPFSMHHAKNPSSSFSDFFVSNIDYRGDAGLVESAAMAWRTIYNREARRKIGRLVDAFKPDVAHLHNIHHQLTGAIIEELAKRRVPMVQTLHDYQWVCPVYTFLSHGRTCEACRGGKYFNAVKKRCQDGSLARSVVAMMELELAKRKKWREAVGLHLAPSRFLADKVVEHGMPRESVRQQDYSLRVGQVLKKSDSVEPYALYAGRLSKEKGVGTLLEAVNRIPGLSLRIAGTGPIEPELRRTVESSEMGDRVHFLGYLNEFELEGAVNSAAFTVVPSEWYENQPFAVLESFAASTPVVGSRMGGIPELVRENETGFLFHAGSVDDLSETLERAWTHKDLAGLGASARDWVVERFDPNRHIERLVSIYNEVAV